MKNIFTILFTITAVYGVSAADIRIVSNVHVDLTPVHNWMENHEGDRPMPHWKQINILEVLTGAPWPVCKLAADGKSKTVYLKNIPLLSIQYWNQFNDLTTRIANLKKQIAVDEKRYESADAVQAEYGSQFSQNRNQFYANLQNSKRTLDELREQLSELQTRKKDFISDFAMFTGQIYNKMEVWDCGQKTQ